MSNYHFPRLLLLVPTLVGLSTHQNSKICFGLCGTTACSFSLWVWSLYIYPTTSLNMTYTSHSTYSECKISSFLIAKYDYCPLCTYTSDLLSIYLVGKRQKIDVIWRETRVYSFTYCWANMACFQICLLYVVLEWICVHIFFSILCFGARCQIM